MLVAGERDARRGRLAAGRRSATPSRPSALHSRRQRGTSPPLPTTRAAPRLSPSRSISARRDSFAAPVHPTRGVSPVSRKFLVPGALALALFCRSARMGGKRRRSRADPRGDPATEGKLRSAHTGARAAAEGRRGAAIRASPRPAPPLPRRPLPRGHVFVERSSPRSTRRFRRCSKAATPICRRIPKDSRSAALPRAARSARASAAFRSANRSSRSPPTSTTSSPAT